MSFITFITTHIDTSTIALTVAVTILLIYTLYLDHKLVMFTKGANGASLETTIQKALEKAATIEERNELIAKHVLMLEEKISHTIRNAETIRYKAFDQNGSNQSFSLALVNELGNGVVISTLHAHERISTFAKPIQNYESSYELTDEEKHVLDNARTAHKKKSSLL